MTKESPPLGEMSPNIQESEVAGRKRSHDEFDADVVHLESEPIKKPSKTSPQSTVTSLPPAHDRPNPDPSPQASPALTEGGNSTTTHGSSPQTPSKMAHKNTSDSAPSQSAASATQSPANPPAKRKRLTPAEKEAKEKEKTEKAAARAAELERQEQEKAARAKEREEKKKLKEEEDRIKAEEKEKEREEKRKKKEEEDKIKAQKAHEREEKKRKKDEEARQAQETKEKKARQQPKLMSFFGAPTTPKKSVKSVDVLGKDSPAKDSPGVKRQRAAESEYQKRFKPFFVKEHTYLAPAATQMDEETKTIKSTILEEFLSGERTLEKQSSFNAVELFTLPDKPRRRGMLHHPVKHIMENVYKESGAGGDEANKALKEARVKLGKVPVKVISFSQDVRPPYYGTVTFKPFALGAVHMRKLARLSTARRLPLDYEYDSEAEWQEEEGEDLDADDDEEEIDDEDDMDGFLDDSEDLGPARRVFVNTIEPESSGVCFENEHRQGPNAAVYQHKMEIIIDNFDRSGGLDPWSSSYWEPEPKSTVVEKTTAKMLPPAAPKDAFSAITAAPVAPAKVVKHEIMNDVKKAILDNKTLSKVGIVDFVFNQFRDIVTRTEVKNTLELVAEKKGTGHRKEWTLRTGHDITA